MVSKKLTTSQKKKRNLSINWKLEVKQYKALKSAKILRRILKILGDSLSLRILWKTIE